MELLLKDIFSAKCRFCNKQFYCNFGDASYEKQGDLINLSYFRQNQYLYILINPNSNQVVSHGLSVGYGFELRYCYNNYGFSRPGSVSKNIPIFLNCDNKCYDVSYDLVPNLAENKVLIEPMSEIFYFKNHNFIDIIHNNIRTKETLVVTKNNDTKNIPFIDAEPLSIEDIGKKATKYMVIS